MPKAWLALLLLGAPAANAFIGEPETLVYGRILNRSNPNLDQLVTEGELLWTIRKPDGTTIELSGDVDVLDGGNYSYLLRIPHQAMMLGQEQVPQTLPLGTTATTASHVAISLDGSPAGILAPATSGFDLDQLLRASAMRLDLEINAAQQDSDNDGMPDWWEDANGLDKQNGGDALTDLNGNGVNNLGEYEAGTDPNHDSTLPLLVTREVIAYSESTSLVLLETADSDSTPDQLTYTVHSVPTGGRLLFRNATPLPDETATELEVGSTFTQADVLAGRLVFEHAAGENPVSFDVGVNDENPEHPESTGSVQIRLFEPVEGVAAASAPEGMRMEALRLARENGHLVADLSATSGKHRLSAPTTGMTEGDYQTHLATFGGELPHILMGGPSDDVLSGGFADDFLHGDAGADTLAGGRGADTFLFLRTSDGADEILDFNPAEGDVLDLTGLMNGSSSLLTDYVRIRRSGADALVEVCAAGTKVGFTDLVIRLRNSPLQPGQVPDLYYAGNIQSGDVSLPPRIGIVASSLTASENGPTDGIFTISREGSNTEDLLVNFVISGNATNGVDYQNLPSTVLIPAGSDSVSLVIRPYVDPNVEFNETVHIELGSSGSYLISGNLAADMVIEDLKPQISLEVLDGLASVADSAPGALLMRRGGLLSPEVFVQFTLSGTAVNGVDYNYVTPYVTLAAGQTTRLIQFTPKPSVNFGAAEAKSIRMTVKSDASYAIPAPAAEVLIVPEKIDYNSWLADNGLPAGGDESAEGGMSTIMRYAFSVDPARPFEPASLARMPKATMEDGYLTLRFRRKPALTDLTYQVEYSNDLNQWFTGSTVVEDVTRQVAPNDPGAAVYRSKIPVSGAKSAAMRVQLIQTPENP